VQTQTATRPRFRQDLVAEPIEDEGQRFIDVIDPDTGAAFRFYEVEYSLACAMDGERDVGKLVAWAQEELGVTPTPTELLSVIATLGDLGYLDSGVPVDGVAREPELAVGVVAARPSPPPSGIDVELGMPGPASRAPAIEPPAPRFDLGAAGATPAKPDPARTIAGLGGDMLGPAGAKLPAPPPLAPVPQSMSEDLSDQMSIKVDDVKEAVRASKVMRSVDLPPDLQAALDSSDVPPAPELPRTPPQIHTPPVVRPPQPSIQTPTPVQTPRPHTQPHAQPQPKLPQPMPVPESTGTGTSPILIVLLVLVILGGGAFALWKYVLSKDDAPTTGKTTQPVGSGGSAGTAAPQPPPPPPPITGTLTMATPPAVEVKATIGGPIDEIAEDGATVAIGDRIAKLGGADRYEGRLRTATFQVNRKTRDVAEAKLRLEQAQKDGKQKEINARQAALEDNEESLAKYTEDKTKAESELAKYTLSAPVAGTIKLATSKGKRIRSDDVIATITPPSFPTVAFDLPETRKMIVDQPVSVVASEGKKLACTVTEVDGTKVSVRCPTDGAPPDGTKVTLE
jgi:hypothetical protein